MDNEGNVRSVMELLGASGRLAQGADGELLVSFKATELGFAISTSISSAAITSMPSLTVGTMPSLTVGSLPSLTVGSIPSLTVGSLPAVNPTMPTILYEGLLSGADATLYTAAANWRQIEIYLVNVDTVARTATLYRGNAGADANTIVKARAVPVNDRVPEFLPALATGEKINGLCDSANKVKIEIWGVSA